MDERQRPIELIRQQGLPTPDADPWFIHEGLGIGVVAATICIWAWRLLRVPAIAR